MFGDFRIDHIGAERLQPVESPFLVGSNQARIARHIGRKNRRKPTFDASCPLGLHGASLLVVILHQQALGAHKAKEAPTGAPFL
jgi:hypothetical protein